MLNALSSNIYSEYSTRFWNFGSHFNVMLVCPHPGFLSCAPVLYEVVA